jgi:Ice-binding-like
MNKNLSIVSVVGGFLMLCGFHGCSHGGGHPGPIPNPNGKGPAPIKLAPYADVPVAGDLAASGSYVILAESEITNTTGSAVTGNMGLSPAAASFVTGFALVADATNVFSTSASVTGKVYAADFAPPTPSNLTQAVGQMQAAYTDGQGRSNPDFNELAAGQLGGLTLAPGLYKWTTVLSIATDLTLSGGPNDVFIFQTSGDVDLAAAKKIVLAGGVTARTIFWVVAGKVTIETTAHFEGIVLCQTGITLQTNASLTGRILCQTAAILDNNVVTQP